MQPKRLLTAEEWVDFFDERGSRRDEELTLSMIDFREVESAEALWTTSQWDEAKHRFVFFARSPPEVVQDAIRGTEADASIFMEMGGVPVETSPPPAHQLVDDSIDVDLVDNAAHSLTEGVSSYLAARNTSDRLVNAIPQLFRSVELLLKARLQDIDPHALIDHPNNPAVLKRLAAAGVSVSVDELDTVTRLRRLRNDLQHGTAILNHRTGLSLCRKTIIFLNRFVNAELGLWLAGAIPPDDWFQLLKIPEISAIADKVVSGLLESVDQQPGATVAECPRCTRSALVRPHRKTGASCLYCGHIPIYKEQAEDEKEKD